MSCRGITSKILTQKKKIHKLIVFNLLESCQCGICHEFLSEPMMISCGHNYCYKCLKNWFMSNATRELNCPSCREPVVNEPCLNLIIEQTLKSLFDILKARKKKIFKEEKERKEFEELLRERFDDSYYYKNDKEQSTLYDNVFKNSALAIADVDDDGIPRCSNCHWELEPEDMEDENVCPHCHSRIRNNASAVGTNRSISLNDRPIMNAPRDDYSENEYEEIVNDIRNFNPSDVESSGEADSSDSIGYDHDRDETHNNDSEEEHDSELDSFIADDDEEDRNISQLSDGERNRNISVLPSDEDRDSDYYENNDSDGFVSGDSLADSNSSGVQDRAKRDTVELSEEDDEEELGNNAKRQRKVHMVLSDDE
ncbi:similar to Saccharomyces cerevisiae YOL054W PSH1 E3 ubiquitin ligase that mediates poyubiquitination and degradation of centromere-binding protein Cse4p and prevents Cse4p from mislocalizing to euchromatin [Maudiozyma barnettii]|uniref:RING-type domain-containing protein n=1 Tax=Maudiozyma barnettii TaxID=61262 RepID=A0A8H2ZGP3_9SACH|nr:ubiquitin-protein ligase PSH1 [Kazachstania barnettii]CAB4252950.1 similar to Saccharomyces cerevisiae YOL054W PSH1 E3 ubiquitin ligase that mediates poyubiquitination and degradation of centromere-binding protein Cse4p and prevents Cse4p from mislocalizing to euchromatin [Kazachstania barnettii]CAD1780745.1 similar to Saccharomyces cerevisiae YOL054W PSH1 E3 ubiquitin ligase that mediates poyubiquitination and degradation of centromere-binding protein Cse4p and prevents Cse4p from mislocalizi